MNLLVMLCTAILILLFIAIEILFSEHILLIKNICLGTAYFFFSFVIISGALFGFNIYSLRLSYTICFVIAVIALTLLYFLKYGSVNKILQLNRVKYFSKGLFILLVIGLLCTFNKFEFFGMGQDQGVYQTKAIYLINGINDNQVDFKEYYYFNGVNDKNELKSFIDASGRVNTNGFYPFSNNANRGTVSIDGQYGPVSGFFHGIPNLAALLSISGKIFGIGGMLHIQTLFYLLAAAIIYITLSINLKLKKFTAIIITLLFEISPLVLWVSKSGLTEIFLCLIISSLVFLLTDENKASNWLVWLPISSFAFFHVSIYTLMPVFIFLFVVLFVQRSGFRYDLLFSSIMSVIMYVSGFWAMSYSSPQYTFDNYRSLTKITAKFGFGMSKTSSLVLMAGFAAILFLFAIYLVIKKFKYKLSTNASTNLLRFFTLFCLFVIIINWFVTSFSVPDANDRYVSYKNIGLLPAFGHLTLSAYAYAVGCLPLVISIYYIFRRDSKLLSAKIVPLIVLMVYTVFFYSAFLRKDIPYFFYYSRYLAPFLPVLLVVSGICINGIKVSYKRMFALVSILILMPFSSFLWFNKDHSRIYFDALEQIINEVKTFKNEDAVFISLDLMPILYLPLEASVDCMVLPFSKYDYFQQVDSPERNTYILSKENSFEIAQLFPAKSSLYERPEGNKLIVYPLKSNKINYNIYLNKTDRPGVLVPIYNYGEELIFGTGGNELMYLDTGWSHDEDGFRWTDASKASLLIPIYSTNKDLLVTLTGNPYQGQPLGDITVNGTRLDYSFNEEGILSFEIPQELANSELRIEFSLPNASSPPTADARLLGIAVSKLLITEI